MFTSNALNRKVQEHTDLDVMLSHAMERVKNAHNSKEYWDAWAEVQILKDELKDTETHIGGENVGIWS